MASPHEHAHAPLRPVRIVRFREAAAREEDDAVAAEEPLEIRVNGESIAVTMRTPGADLDLVRGFLLTEGIVETAGELLDLRLTESPYDRTPGNVVDARVPPDVAARRAWRRNTYATSSCGVCGKASIDMVRALRPRVEGDVRVAAGTLAALPVRLRERQAVFEATGGLHAAAAFDAEGRLLALREDVGRHNAVDKLVGWAMTEARVPASGLVLLVSGRAGFEIVQKAAVAGFPLVAAVGAPSSLAVELAEEANVTLVGFLRDRGMNVYAGAARVA